MNLNRENNLELKNKSKQKNVFNKHLQIYYIMMLINTIQTRYLLSDKDIDYIITTIEKNNIWSIASNTGLSNNIARAFSYILMHITNNPLEPQSDKDIVNWLILDDYYNSNEPLGIYR